MTRPKVPAIAALLLLALLPAAACAATAEVRVTTPKLVLTPGEEAVLAIAARRTGVPAGPEGIASFILDLAKVDTPASPGGPPVAEFDLSSIQFIPLGPDDLFSTDSAAANLIEGAFGIYLSPPTKGLGGNFDTLFTVRLRALNPGTTLISANGNSAATIFSDPIEITPAPDATTFLPALQITVAAVPEPAFLMILPTTAALLRRRRA